MKYVTASQCNPICIGRQGENKVITVQFDVSGWQETYGVGSFSLLHQRSADMSAYPCVITADTNTVSWVVTSTDVFYVGYGKAQLLYIVDDKVAKSVVFTTNTLQSLNAGDAPDPEPEWITDVINAGLDAEAYAVGTRNGTDVSPDDPAYHNNAKYYAELQSGKIFWCTPNVTTLLQIVNAISRGDSPVVVSQNGQITTYLPLTYNGAGFYNFCAFTNSEMLEIWHLSKFNGQWTFETRNF